MAAQSSILAWKILWTYEPGGLQSVGSQKNNNNKNHKNDNPWHILCLEVSSGSSRTQWEELILGPISRVVSLE